MEKRTSATRQSQHFAYVWLVAAIILLFFANGRHLIFLATWLAPVFLMRYLRSQALLPGLLIGVLVNAVITTITWQGMIPVPGAWIILVGGMIGILSFMPYLVDRLVVAKSTGFLSTLVFPCAWVGFEYLNSLFNPYTTWGSLIYTQVNGPLAFLQLVSLVGLWGPVFLLTWFASVVNWLWETNWMGANIKIGVVVYLGIVSGVILAGGLRLTFFPSVAETVRVAAIVSPFEWDLKQDVSDPAELAELRQTTLNVQGEFLKLSKQAVLGGADIILWSEAAAPVFEQDETTVIGNAATLASKLGVYLMLSLYTRPHQFPRQPWQNKVILLDQEGKTRFEYLKSRPVPGENSKRGDGDIPFTDTPFGRIGAAICYDMDFPDLMRQAGQKKIDLMLVPADDWVEITPLHTYMASIRAIENGFSLVRATNEGMSGAFDYQGRLLTSMNEFTSSQKIMYADLPTKGAKSLYPVIGDLFAWLCLVGLVLLIWRKRPGKKRKRSSDR
jgi:apolipoprotein N-acyltransferase